MAKFVAKDYFILINGTSLSDHCSQLDVTDTADQIDFTTFGPAAYKQFGQGFHDATINATFFNDFAANSVAAILQPLYQTGGTFAVEVRPTSAARSATNPAALMTATLYSYTGISGAVGAASTMQCAFKNASTAGLTWATV